MAKVFKVTLTADRSWLEAVQRMFEYVEGLEVARITSIEDAGVTEDYFTPEEIADLSE